jgi:peptide/nickel transport system permease protein
MDSLTRALMFAGKRTTDMAHESQADGGSTTEQSVFEVVADTDPLTRKERGVRWVDVHVLTPLRIIKSDWRATVGILIVVAFVLIGTIGPLFVEPPPIGQYEAYLDPFQSWAYPLGTDGFGQPILPQLILATPNMLKMAFAGAVLAVGLGTVVGTMAGYKGGRIDTVLMSVSDVMLTIPALPLIVVLVVLFQGVGENPYFVGFLLAIDNWPGLARALRSQVLTIREESYVEAGRAMGRSSWEILQDDIIPQMMPYVTINSATAARRVVFESVALYFLGVLPTSTFNWGVMMNFAFKKGAALTNPGLSGHWLYFPMLMLIILSLGLILLSQGMDRIFNPRLRARHEETAAASDEQPPN